MGIRLVVEVLDHAPAELTAAELAVLFVIAEDARDSTRVSHCGREVVLRRCRLGPRGLRHAFERLARRGLEVRVPIGLDSTGRPLYAVPGQQSTYRIPHFMDAKGDSHVLHKGDPQVRQADAEVREADAEVREADAQVPPSPQPSAPQQQHARTRAAQPPAHIRMIMDKTGATVDEARAVADLVTAEKAPDHLGAFLRRLAGDGELGEWLTRVRERLGRARDADHRVHIRGQPECEHGVAGGHIPASSGWVACPLERRRLAAVRTQDGRT